MFGILIVRQSYITALEHENSQLKADYKNLETELTNLKTKFSVLQKDVANHNILKAERDKLSKDLEKECKLNRHLEAIINKYKEQYG